MVSQDRAFYKIIIRNILRKVLKSDAFGKIFLIMAGKDSYKSLEDWIEKYQSNGRLTFSLPEAQL